MDEALDEGPFFHGTKAELQVGDHLTAGFRSNYRPEIVMNHVYFTALRDGAGLAAELAAGDGTPRVYVVDPTGEFENDPNVTDKKFPGNPTRSIAAGNRSGSLARSRTGPDRHLKLSRCGETGWPQSVWTTAPKSSTEGCPVTAGHGDMIMVGLVWSRLRSRPG
ncbi:hypothetical protein GCM10010393_31090 [Streptomyces gobitricini]|uniref:Rifampin ADP-ribosyltransferase domain-containing protein n=1 Tax=Streptomyces gobitricini TaxID=68211 RepID=A0ABN3M9S1_9ACTN